MNIHPTPTLASALLGLLTACSTSFAADDAWFAEANERIEIHRKAPLTIKVVDSQGKSIEGATVEVKMTRHAFEFGSAVKVAYINDPEQETYRQKILEFFNSGTFENALKVKAWSGDFGPAVGPDATVKALHWTQANHIKIRGHAMTGNGLRNSSKPFIKIHQEGGKEALIQAVLEAIDDKASRTKFSIDEWDVVNPPVGINRPGRKPEGAGNARPSYLEKEWLTPALQRIIEQQGVRLALADSEGNPVWGEWATGNTRQTLRTSVQAQLPWTLQLTSVDPGSFMAEIKQRRRLFWGGLAAMVALVLAAGYAIVRSVERELTVARLQGDFVSAVSHEFRTPLASLCHLSELLVEGRVATDQRRQEYYQALRRESERLHRLVESILDFGRMEDGAREYQMEWLDTATFIREVAAEFAEEVKD